MKKCMGCGGCEVACPAKAIKIEMSQDGFWRPIIDKEKCINCDKCDTICPVTIWQTKPALEAYSYKSKSKVVLEKSASGGFGYDLSSVMIDSFPVCSVEYDTEKAMPIHKVAKSSEDLEKRRNSIYLQSYTVSGFREILSLKQGVVFGSPCQISFLNNLLIQKKLREYYILIDFFVMEYLHIICGKNTWNLKGFFLKRPMLYSVPKETVGETSQFSAIMNHNLFILTKQTMTISFLDCFLKIWC